jgi:glycine/D-amino acid oxidase-like deaminating enzyme
MSDAGNKNQDRGAEPRRMDRRRFLASLLAAPLVSRIASLDVVRREPRAESREPRALQRDHVVVVGAGAFGGWTALALLRAGARVTLVDAWGAGNSRASSGGETRVIRAVYHGEPLYSQMVARALVLWHEAEQRWQQQVFFPIGALWMCAGDDSYVRPSIAPMKALGLPIEEMTPADAARRYPQMGFEGVRSVFFEPRAGYLLARLSCELVLETFVREGGEYKVAQVRPGGSTGGRMSSVALADGSTLEADQFVFACGPWMGGSQLFPDVVGRRIVATRQEIFFFGTPAGSTQYDPGTLPAWVHISDRIVYGIPGNERRGMKVADDSAGEEVNPTTLDRAPSATGLANARRIVRERFPALADAPLVEARVCQYEASSDGNYLVDRHPGLDNVWLVGGGSGHGFKMGPALGEHVAALVQGRATVHPLFAYGRLRPRP